MSKLQKKDGPEKVAFSGRILEVVQQPMRVGTKKTLFERARRAPGVRLIIIKDGKLLLTREFRYSQDDYDYRLPGGKVFDTLSEYKKYIGEDIMPFALKAAKAEAKEEAGVTASEINHFVTAESGATVQWDLIYFIVDSFTQDETEQDLGLGEEIDVHWKTFDEVKELIKNGHMNEYRSVGVLFRYLLQDEVSGI